LTLYWYNCHK